MYHGHIDIMKAKVSTKLWRVNRKTK